MGDGFMIGVMIFTHARGQIRSYFELWGAVTGRRFGFDCSDQFAKAATSRRTSKVERKSIGSERGVSIIGGFRAVVICVATNKSCGENPVTTQTLLQVVVICVATNKPCGGFTRQTPQSTNDA